jgi:hypothetical protein
VSTYSKSSTLHSFPFSIKNISTLMQRFKNYNVF